MSDESTIEKFSFLQFSGKHQITLGEISIYKSGQQSWDASLRTFSQGVETSSNLVTVESESAKESWLSRARESFSTKDGWFEYKPRHTVGDLRLHVNKSHSDFVEIAILEDESPKSNIAVRSFSAGVETGREVLSFSSESKRHARLQDLLKEYSPENGWYTFSIHHGWDALPDKTSLPIITSYVRVLGVFEDDYEFPDVSSRSEAKGRAEIEFGDYSVVDRTTDQVFGFERVEAQTKAVKAVDGSTSMEASVKALWWSDYYPVEAVCEGEAEQIFLEENSNRFAVIGAWDPNEYIQFKELRPQSTRTIQSAHLPTGLERKLNDIQEQSSTEISFKVAELEWIFFGALGYQQEVFGGVKPAIDYGDSGTEFFEKWGRPNFGSEVGFYWPPNQLLNGVEESFLIDLFLRYRLLWEAEPIHGDLLSLEVVMNFEIASLADSIVRESIAERIQGQTWGQHSFLAAETVRLLQSKPAFSN